MSPSLIIFDFTKESNLQEWAIVDDNVMGGRSNGKILLNEDGHAVFMGDVSLDNNGGFSSVRYSMEPQDIREYTKVVLRVKGDGLRYQLRLKPNKYDRHSYIQYFTTHGEWQTIEIELSSFYATFRGRLLDMPHFHNDILSEVAFLVGNKKAESFRLEIDHIGLI